VSQFIACFCLQTAQLSALALLIRNPNCGLWDNWEKDPANAAAAFGVLLRDFSCSQSAKQVAGKFPAAGPVTR
jgi:hypothetical protein